MPGSFNKGVPGEKSRWLQRAILCAVCLLIIGVYAYEAHSGVLESLSPNASGTYYNLLVQGFRAGQLNLKIEVPPGLVQLPDPYDPSATAVYRYAIPRIHDMTYYKGRLYLYFGVTPALILFWPFVALTGCYLFHREAMVIFCSIGFLTSVWLLYEIWRCYFAEVSIWVVVGCVLALGLATGVPVILARCEVYEVATSCGGMLTMLSLLAIWRALNEPERKCQWLAAASLAYGLALGARPSLLFGAVILLIPVASAWRQRKQIWVLLIAAICPITLIGLGLMLYNFLRFGSPFEFGIRYQLASYRQVAMKIFDWHYLWFNLKIYFLEPARWTTHFPFVHEITEPPLLPGYTQVEGAFGILSSIPLVWLAAAVPLAWRGRSALERSVLRRFVIAIGLFLGICVLTNCLFPGGILRYEVEFLPALLLLTTVGILGLERLLAERPRWRRTARVGWGLLLVVSVAFNLFAGIEHYARTQDGLGVAYGEAGRLPEAIEHFQQAVRIDPDYADAHDNLALVLWQSGNVKEAIAQYERVAILKPDSVEAYDDLGNAMFRLGKTSEAIGYYEQALRIKPDYAEPHIKLGMAFAQVGRAQEAVEHLQQALQIQPESAEAHYILGVIAVRSGKVPEAISHWEQALRINPDYAESHYNLGVALEQAGKIKEAVGHYERAIQIKPDYAQAQKRLTALQAVP